MTCRSCSSSFSRRSLLSRIKEWWVGVEGLSEEETKWEIGTWNKEKASSKI